MARNGYRRRQRKRAVLYNRGPEHVNGYSWSDWLIAAGNCCAPEQLLKAAWKRGEDPREYRPSADGEL